MSEPHSEQSEAWRAGYDAAGSTCPNPACVAKHQSVHTDAETSRIAGELSERLTHLDSGPRDASPLCGADGMLADVSSEINDVTCQACADTHEGITEFEEQP